MLGAWPSRYKANRLFVWRREGNETAAVKRRLDKHRRRETDNVHGARAEEEEEFPAPSGSLEACFDWRLLVSWR